MALSSKMVDSLLRFAAAGLLAAAFIVGAAALAAANCGANCNPPPTKPDCCCFPNGEQAPTHQNCDTNCPTTGCSAGTQPGVVIEATCWEQGGSTCERVCNPIAVHDYQCQYRVQCTNGTLGGQCYWVQQSSTQPQTCWVCGPNATVCNPHPAFSCP